MAKEQLKTGREHPFAVRKVPWDALWHVQYYMKGPEGDVYVTWDRVKEREALRAAKKLVSQYGCPELPVRLWWPE